MIQLGATSVKKFCFRRSILLRTFPQARSEEFLYKSKVVRNLITDIFRGPTRKMKKGLMIPGDRETGDLI